jgi:High potential iron-sulfur protein
VLHRVVAGLSCAAVLPMLLSASPVAADETSPVKESDARAVAVHYVDDASKSKEAASSGANCANCSLYSARGDNEGTCTLFGGQRVQAAGWCSAWSGL